MFSFDNFVLLRSINATSLMLNTFSIIKSEDFPFTQFIRIICSYNFILFVELCKNKLIKLDKEMNKIIFFSFLKESMCI